MTEVASQQLKYFFLINCTKDSHGTIWNKAFETSAVIALGTEFRVTNTTKAKGGSI